MNANLNIGLTPQTEEDLQHVMSTLGLSRADAANQAIQFYAFAVRERAEGSQMFLGTGEFGSGIKLVEVHWFTDPETAGDPS